MNRRESSLVLEGVLVESGVSVVVSSKLKNAGIGVGCGIRGAPSQRVVEFNF